MNGIDGVKRFFGVMSLVTVVVGTVTNLLSCGVCLRKQLRNTPTFIFMAFMTISDTIPLYAFNLDTYFYQIFFQQKLSNTNWFYCKIQYFIHYFPLKTSAWLLVAMSTESYLSIQIKSWRIRLYNSKKAVITAGMIMAIFLVSDFYLVFITDYRTISHNSTGTCITLNIVAIRAWAEMNTYLYSLVPFFFLMLFNMLSVYRAYIYKVKSLSRNGKSSIKSMTLIVTIRTLSFVVLTGPIAITAGYFSTSLTNSIWLQFMNFLRFSNHSLNFFFLILFNRRFKQEFNGLFSKSKITPVNKSGPENTKTIKK